MTGILPEPEEERLKTYNIRVIQDKHNVKSTHTNCSLHRRFNEKANQYIEAGNLTKDDLRVKFS